jgi:hypothetical protein
MWPNRYWLNSDGFCLRYMMCVGKKPADALPKRTIMKFIVVTAFERRCDRKFAGGRDEVACTVKSSSATRPLTDQ